MGLSAALTDFVSLNLSLSLAALWNLSITLKLMQIHKEDYRCSQPQLCPNLLTHVGHTELNLNRYLSAKANAKERRGI